MKANCFMFSLLAFFADNNGSSSLYDKYIKVHVLQNFKKHPVRALSWMAAAGLLGYGIAKRELLLILKDGLWAQDFKKFVKSKWSKADFILKIDSGETKQYSLINLLAGDQVFNKGMMLAVGFDDIKKLENRAKLSWYEKIKIIKFYYNAEQEVKKNKEFVINELQKALNSKKILENKAESYVSSLENAYTEYLKKTLTYKNQSELDVANISSMKNKTELIEDKVKSYISFINDVYGKLKKIFSEDRIKEYIMKNHTIENHYFIFEGKKVFIENEYLLKLYAPPSVKSENEKTYIGHVIYMIYPDKTAEIGKSEIENKQYARYALSGIVLDILEKIFKDYGVESIKAWAGNPIILKQLLDRGFCPIEWGRLQSEKLYTPLRYKAEIVPILNRLEQAKADGLKNPGKEEPPFPKEGFMLRKEMNKLP